MGTTNQSVIALIFKLTVFDSECMPVTINSYLIFVTGLQFFSPFVPGELDFWIINLNVDFKDGIIIFQNCLVFNILDQGDRLEELICVSQPSLIIPTNNFVHFIIGTVHFTSVCVSLCWINDTSSSNSFSSLSDFSSSSISWGGGGK